MADAPAGAPGAAGAPGHRVPHTRSRDAARWLLEHRWGTSPGQALDFFAGLPPQPVDALRGRWHGSGWHTGHGWDGLLEAYGWYGKEFDGPERVRPMLFRDRSGDPVPVSPRLAPVGLLRARPGLARSPVPRAGFRLLLRVLESGRPAGRLRVVEHHGTPTAALVYDHLPIVDLLRRVTDDLVLGAADIRGEPTPLFFVLRRSARSASAPTAAPS